MICEVVLLDEQHRPEVWPLSVSTADVRKIMRGVCKVVRPDNIPDRVLKTCQSTDFLTYIFIISLSQEIVPNCFEEDWRTCFSELLNRQI